MSRNQEDVLARVPTERARGHAAKTTRGHHFSELPAETQQAVLQGIFGACSRWLVLTHAAPPDSSPTIIEPGRRIAILRQVANLTQAELAHRAGVRQADVSRAEKAFSDVKLATLERILSALGTTIEAIRSTDVSDVVE